MSIYQLSQDQLYWDSSSSSSIFCRMLLISIRRSSTNFDLLLLSNPCLRANPSANISGLSAWSLNTTICYTSSPRLTSITKNGTYSQAPQLNVLVQAYWTGNDFWGSVRILDTLSRTDECSVRGSVRLLGCLLLPLLFMLLRSLLVQGSEFNILFLAYLSLRPWTILTIVLSISFAKIFALTLHTTFLFIAGVNVHSFSLRSNQRSDLDFSVLFIVFDRLYSYQNLGTVLWDSSM